MNFNMTEDEILDRISYLEYQVDKEFEPFFCDEIKIDKLQDEIIYLEHLLQYRNKSCSLKINNT